MDEDRGGRRGGFDRGPRQMYDAVCADCGQATQVPFKPDAATRPLWYASHSQKYGCQRKVAARNMPTTKPAKRTAPATANRWGGACSASTPQRIVPLG